MALPKVKTCTINDIEALPEGTRVELIDGEMHMLAAPSRIHQDLSMGISALIYNHIKENGKTCHVYTAPFAVYLNDDSDYVEPDISVICDESKLDEKGCHGGPDWVIEIVSPGSRQRDYLVKPSLYASAGVREYWIINPVNSSVIVYRFDSDSILLAYTFDDAIPVSISDGLKISVSAVIGH